MSAIDQLPLLPKSYKDPSESPVPIKVLAKWDLFLGEIAAGTPIQDAMMKYFIKRAEIEACIRLSPEQRQRWEEARLAARKRNWSAFDLEDIFQKISGGMPIGQAVQEVRDPGGSNSDLRSEFTYLCTADPELHELYLKACKSRAIITGEAILDIADGDGRGDYLDNGKGGFTPDGAKVNRDKLRVETRTKLMSSWFPKLFGEKKGDTNVNIQINHAERLEAARARRDTKSANRLPKELIEATFRDRPALEAPAEKNDWDDVPSSDAVASSSTVWREEA